MPEMLSAVRELNESFKEAIAEQKETRRELAGLRSQLDALPDLYLSKDVAKAKSRLMVAALVLLLIFGVGVFGIVLRFKNENDQRVRDQQSALVAGCQRSNDQRSTLREVIDEAVVVSPAPPNLPGDLQELYDQSQSRVAALRTKLLALPGVQPVDCEKAFSAPDPAR